MNLIEKISKIENLTGTYWIERICSQIGYAARLSSVKGGKFDELLENTVDFILEEKQNNGVITNETAQKAEKMLEPISKTAKKIKVYAVSHAHLDMDWMWGFSETSTITIETFRTVLDLMNEYPEFTFSQSQASTYKIIEEYSPEMLPEIKRRVKEGRWEVTASTWTETDKNMPSGESLSRHILYTKRYLSKLLDIKYDKMRLDFEPDTFGHNINVPEILTRGGVKYYYHCRGYDKEYIFRWKSKSGAEILVYREPKWYNADINYRSFVDLPIFCNDYNIDISLKVYGIGDHGGGPTRRDIERLIDIKSWPVMPSVEFGTYHKFFAELEKYKEKFAVVEDELNFVFTGCYTSQSRIKMANRISEARLFESEAICTVSSITGGSDYGNSFGKAWENVLYSHFHDIIPGSGVTETREYTLGLFQKTLSHIYANSSNALRFLAANIDTSKAKSLYSKNIEETISEGAGVGFGIADKESGTYNYLLPKTERGAGDARIFHLINPTQYKRREAVNVTVWDLQYPPEKALFKDTEGNKIKSKFLNKEHYWGHNYFVYAILCDIEPFSYKTYILDIEKSENYRFSSTSDPRTQVVKDCNLILENDLVSAEFDRKTLKLISYTDKENNNKLISETSAYFKFINEDHRSNAWIIGSYMKTVDLNEEYNVRLLKNETDNKNLVSQFTYEIEFLSSKLNVTVILKENSRILEFFTEIDWREQSGESITPQIGFFVPLSYEIKNYRYDIPFGTIDRDGINDDRPANTFVAALPKNKNSGTAVLINDTRYGYRCVNNSIYLNLLHTSKNPDQHPETDKHTVRIGLLASKECDNTEFFRESSAFLHPIAYMTNKPHEGKLPYNGGNFLKVEGNVKISALKTPENEDEKNNKTIVIRLYDIGGKNGKAVLNFAYDIKEAEFLDIMEMPADPEYSAASNLYINEKILSFDLIKYGVATIKVRFN